jgi:hypothetical protein
MVFYSSESKQALQNGNPARDHVVANRIVVLANDRESEAEEAIARIRTKNKGNKGLTIPECRGSNGGEVIYRGPSGVVAFSNDTLCLL